MSDLAAYPEAPIVVLAIGVVALALRLSFALAHEAIRRAHHRRSVRPPAKRDRSSRHPSDPSDSDPPESDPPESDRP